jgi:hypothetical protein
VQVATRKPFEGHALNVVDVLDAKDLIETIEDDREVVSAQTVNLKSAVEGDDEVDVGNSLGKFEGIIPLWKHNWIFNYWICHFRILN